MSQLVEKKLIRRKLSKVSFEDSDLHPVLQRVLSARALNNVSELDYSLSNLLHWELLSGIRQAVDILIAAIDLQQRILIIADYDTDGATACAVAIRGLRMFGVEHVDYLVPNRFEYGYGLSVPIVQLAAERGAELLITVDNGIASHEGVAAARQLGMQVIVTDHHLPGSILPDADSIVNPNLLHDSFPSKNLAGVGVMFYLLLALRSELRESGWFEARDITEPNLGRLLELVALGTVADVVPLDHNNRILVSHGLIRIRAGHSIPGLCALIEVARKDATKLVASDLGFSIGPRLNAAGRLDDMSVGIECLLTDDFSQAMILANRLNDFNLKRREIEQNMQEEAWSLLDDHILDRNCFSLCLYQPEWHEGIVGIVASRIKERTHRPVIAFALSSSGIMKGSGRSIKGFHMRDALDLVATRNPGLLDKFGGHAMAAGLSLEENKLDEFTTAFEQVASEFLDESALQAVIETDGELEADDFSMQMAALLRDAGPWGQGFPEPVFDGVFTVLSKRIVGEKHLRLSVRLQGTENAINGIAFFQADNHSCEIGKNIRLVYKLDINEYRQQQSLQLLVEYIDDSDNLLSPV